MDTCCLMPRCCCTEVFPYKRYGKSCITDMTLMLLAAREESSSRGPDMLVQMDDNQSHSRNKCVQVGKLKKTNLGQNHAQRPKQQDIPKRAAQAVNSHVLVCRLSPERLLSHHSNKAAPITKSKPYSLLFLAFPPLFPANSKHRM